MKNNKSGRPRKEEGGSEERAKMITQTRRETRTAGSKDHQSRRGNTRELTGLERAREKDGWKRRKAASRKKKEATAIKRKRADSTAAMARALTGGTHGNQGGGMCEPRTEKG